MAPTKQVAANRQNAQKSTGPRTKSGKVRSSGSALKHGLSAEQVVIFDEDPAAFEALRDDLYAHYQPSDPVDDALVEQVAGCIWRLRRVPEIEAAIIEYHYFDRQADRARMSEFNLMSGAEEREAIGRQHERRPVLGDVFERSQRSLSSLIRIAGVIEGSMYRAIRELERRKSERNIVDPNETVIDLEPEDVDAVDPRPRLIDS